MENINQTCMTENQKNAVQMLMKLKPEYDFGEDSKLPEILKHWEMREAKNETSLMADMENSNSVLPLNLSTKLAWVSDQPMEMFGEEGLYTGQCIKFLPQNIPFGIGRFVKKSGAIYEGQFNNGKAQGFMRWFGQTEKKVLDYWNRTIKITQELCTVGQQKDGQIIKYKTYNIECELVYNNDEIQAGKLANHEQEFAGQYPLYKRKVKQMRG